MNATLIHPRKGKSQGFVLLAPLTETAMHWVQNNGQLCLGEGCPYCGCTPPFPARYQWFAPAVDLRSELVSPTAQEEAAWLRNYKVDGQSPPPRTRRRWLLGGLVVVNLLGSQLAELPEPPQAGDMLASTKDKSMVRIGAWSAPPCLPEPFDWWPILIRICGQQKMLEKMRTTQPAQLPEQSGQILKFPKRA